MKKFKPFYCSILWIVIYGQSLCYGQEVIITIDKAVEMAMKSGPGISSAECSIEAAKYSKKKSLGGFFPVLSGEIRSLYYSEKPGISTGMEFNIDPATIPSPESDFDWWLTGVMSQMSQMMEGFESKHYDITFTITLAQPLSPLYRLYHGYKLAELGVDVAKIQLEKTKEQLRYRVKSTYFSILKLYHGISAMDGAISSVSAHVKQAEQFYNQGLITKNDLLQAKARLAEVERQKISLEGALTTAVEALKAAIGYDKQGNIKLEDPGWKWNGVVPSFSSAMNLAMKNRQDVAELKIRVKQAQEAVKIACGDLIPQISAFGMYQHNEGSIMKMPDFAVGGTLSWNLWQGGSRWYAIKEAKAKQAAAEEALSAIKAQVAVEIREALSNLKVASLILEKSVAEVEASHEQLRIEKERYAQNLNTSTEVLDAQSRVTKAIIERENAKYDIMIAIAQLEKATGSSYESLMKKGD